MRKIKKQKKKKMSNVDPFPLYSIIGREFVRKQTYAMTVAKLKEYLSDMTKEQAELIIVMMIHFYKLSNDGSLGNFGLSNLMSKSKKNALPFGIRPGPQGIGCVLDLDDMSDGLIGLLMEYVDTAINCKK